MGTAPTFEWGRTKLEMDAAGMVQILWMPMRLPQLWMFWAVILTLYHVNNSISDMYTAVLLVWRAEK